MDNLCTPDMFVWRSLMLAIEWGSLVCIPLSAIGGWLLKSPLFYIVMAVLFWAGMAYLADVEVVKVNFICLGITY